MSPLRTCVGCRATASTAELIRVVVDQGVLRQSRQAPGRGAWLHPARGCLELADKRRAWGRALRVQGSCESSGLVSDLMV
ncbi:MAG: DUF448 domain-containing protein [Actinobacteria bacterium]|nr:DUF448 domain-containing protein [Actinomycetota bacterium]MSY38788.1 DUF448 domain-containing protein [Actinomycetota bacterium]MSZ40823.1 DUF448 domain-containing protein [Actinomycetota bacterium]